MAPVTDTPRKPLPDAPAHHRRLKQVAVSSHTPCASEVALSRLHMRISGLRSFVDEETSCSNLDSPHNGSVRSGSLPLRTAHTNLFSVLVEVDRHASGSQTGTGEAEGVPPGAASDSGLAAPDQLSNVAPPALVLLGELGRGAQGVVYAGRWRGLDVAVKSILLRTPPPGSQHSLLQGFDRLSSSDIGDSSACAAAQHAIQEAVIATSLSHPNIVTCYTFQLTPLHEETWAAETPSDSGLGSLARLPAHRTASCTGAPGHSQPEAWRLTLLHMWRLTAKLCDFGMSHRLRTGVGQQADQPTHMSGPQRRSSLYSAPELVRYGHSGYKQDVYAYGVLLWELACGLPLPELLERPVCRPVRDWLREQEAPGSAVSSVPAALLVWPEASPPGLWALAERCLRELPAERPDFREVCQVLEQITG
ncbi:hypothetical protein GPECTOR_1g106 [Gonium pectorale]|uniref:Protein kinase domain-containing protein n=1 Tax=Gonium pectorale TaxID=33097 RepID=A0A150H1V0_GONPE|nr:hypothetical protein GPECTOR_1g106 [Gonium pectorale]|eukprot:KXZ56126.1 hypothetical protein GPECTOR_1g106 [Gonium pectorale]